MTQLRIVSANVWVESERNEHPIRDDALAKVRPPAIREAFVTIPDVTWGDVGGVGSNCVQVVNAFDAKVVAIDVDPSKLDAISNCGAAPTLNSREMDGKGLKTAINNLARDSGLPSTEWFVFECSGTAAGQLTAFGLLVRGATRCVVGFNIDKVEVRLSNLMAFDARALGNWGCSPIRDAAALELVLAGKVKVKPFVETHPPDDINRVFEAAHHREIRRRAVLIPAHSGACHVERISS